MRWLLPSVALLLIASSLPPVAAQDIPALAEDDSGDVTITVATQTQPAPADRYQQADLVKAWAVETPVGFEFTLQAASLEPNPEIPVVDFMEYNLQFRNKDRDFRINTQRFNVGGTGFFSQLEARDQGRGPFYVWAFDLETKSDVAAGTFTVSVPRDMLLDMSGSVPHPGQPFTGFFAWTHGELLGNGNINIGDGGGTAKIPGPVVADRMPNEGNGTGILEIKQGVAQLGLARLFSEVPTRSSNGENTTFVYTVSGVNLGKSSDKYDLVADKVPAGWTVRLPASTLEIAGNGSVTFPVLVSTPFQHIHGEYHGFVIVMASQTDASSVGRIQLGIRYPAIPQPAGHHNKIFLWAQDDRPSELQSGLCTAFNGGAGCSTLYMNAADVDPASTPDLAVPAFNCGSSPPQVTFCWQPVLTPALDLGLDFDVTGTGTLDVTITSDVPLVGATLMGRLMYQGIRSDEFFFPGGGQDNSPPGTMTLATLEASAPQDMSSGAETLFSIVVTPTTDSDFIQYQSGAGMYMDLLLVGTTAGLGFGPLPHPALSGGGVMQLPLIEYHDPVNLTFANTEQLELQVLGSQDRAGNAGKGVLFNVTMVNHGAGGKFRAEVSGNNAAWAQALVPPDFQVGEGATYTIPVAVRIPSSAAQGEVADLVLTVSNLANLNERALARLYVTVDGGSHPDDTKAIDALAGNTTPKKSPGVDAIVLLAGLAAVVALARRGKALK